MRYQCRACELGNHTVPVRTEGPIKSGFFILGRNPGADEDRLNRPFVGRSGELLDIILRHASLQRAGIYITNLCKCHSQKNRDLTVPEITACSAKFLESELEIGKPNVVVALGTAAISYLVGEGNVTLARKKSPYRLVEREFIVVPSYHPSFYLRRGTKLEDVKMGIQDFNMAREIFLGAR